MTVRERLIAYLRERGYADEHHGDVDAETLADALINDGWVKTEGEPDLEEPSGWGAN